MSQNNKPDESGNEKLNAFLPQIDKMRRDLSSDLQTLRQRRMQIEEQRKALDNVQMDKASLEALFLADVDARADLARDQLARGLESKLSLVTGHNSTTLQNPVHVSGRKWIPGDVNFVPMMFNSATPDQFSMMCLLQRESMKRAVKEMFAAVTWPHEDSKPMQETLDSIAKCDAEIAALKAEEDRLLQGAAEAGLQIG